MAKDPEKPGALPGSAREAASSEDGFLRRWSRRKTLAREQQQDDGEQHASAKEVSKDLSRAGTVPAPKQKTDADMPPLEALDENSDYSAFLSPGVSDKLRRTALRKLFHLPSFNIRDGLDDYDEDYTTFEALGNVITADMKHQLQRQKEQMRQHMGEEQVAEDEEEAKPSDVVASDGETEDRPPAGTVGDNDSGKDAGPSKS